MLALGCTMLREARNSQKIETFQAKFAQKYSDVVMHDWMIKVRYDEMSLWCRLSSLTVAPGNRGQQTSELIKVLQVIVFWKVLFLVTDSGGQRRPLSMVLEVPTMIKGIERNNALCLANAMAPVVTMPKIAEQARHHSMLMIADDHPANTSSENHMWATEQFQCSLERYRCMVHKEDKVLKLLESAFMCDSRGILHSSLAFQYGGIFDSWKDHLKAHLRTPGVFKFYVAQSADGAGQAAARYRKSVFAAFCQDYSGMRSAPAYMLYTFARRRLLNGRYGKRNVIEHFCSGCCRDAEHAMEQIEQLIIDRIPPPGVNK